MIGFSLFRRLLLASATLGFVAHAAAAQPALSLDIYNPGTSAIFPVSSVLVSGKKEVILVDARRNVVPGAQRQGRQGRDEVVSSLNR